MKRFTVAMLASAFACSLGAYAQSEKQPERQVEKQAHKQAEKQADKKTEKGAEAGGQMDPAMEAMMKAGAPGAQHKLLEQFEGTWIAEVKEFGTDGSVKSTSPGTMNCKMMFGGRYLHSEFESSFGGMTFKGAGTIGYNNLEKRVESTWVDSMSTQTMYMTGQWDAAGKVLTLTGECVDPTTSQRTTMKEVSTWSGKDACVQEMFDGKGVKVMEISYKRGPAREAKKEAKAEAKREKQTEKQVEKK
jgi:hypothetical protein